MIHSRNEWGRLREVIVGSALGANWPAHDPVFQQQVRSWQTYQPPAGAVPRWIIDETEEDLEALCCELIRAGVQVHRPYRADYVARQGMYNYCPRDRVLVADDCIVDVAMMFPCRDQEINAIKAFWNSDQMIEMPRDQGMVMDAANVCRLGDDWLFLISVSGNRSARSWLQAQFPHKRIHACDFYAGVHIDSTVVPLREGVVMFNAERVTPDTVPEVFRGWQHIYIDQCVSRDFYGYPYASAWIGLNVFSIDANTVIVDSIQTGIINTLEQHGFDVVPLQLRHSRTLGGGFHCVTLDLWREDD